MTDEERSEAMFELKQWQKMDLWGRGLVLGAMLCQFFILSFFDDFQDSVFEYYTMNNQIQLAEVIRKPDSYVNLDQIRGYDESVRAMKEGSDHDMIVNLMKWVFGLTFVIGSGLMIEARRQEFLDR